MVALAEGEKRPLFAMLDALRPLGTSFVPPPGDVAARAPSPVIDAVRRASRQAGGGATGAGLGARELLRQTFVVAPREVANAVTDPLVQVARPAGDFLSALVGGPQSPSPARTSAQAPNFPDLVNVSRATLAAPVGPTARAPLLPGQTAQQPVVQPQQAATSRTAPTFGIDNVPEGGGFISVNDPLSPDRLSRLPSYMRDQLQQTGAIRVTPEQGRNLARQATIVPSTFFTGGAAQPAAVQARSQVDTPRGSTLISDRSQDFDTLLKNLVAQATRTPDSYGELFRRRGVLDALNQVAGVAQGAGTNLTQDVTNLRTVLEQRRGDDLTAQSREADRGVTLRGQNLDFERGYLQTLLGAEAAQSQAAAAQERVKAMRDQTAALTQSAKDRIAAQERMAAAKPAQDLEGDASKQLEAMYATAPPDQKPAILEMLRNLYAARNAAPPLIP